VARSSESAQIYVLAGTNGAGKSSVGGAMILREGATYFNPDEAARKILAANKGITQEVANSAAWHEGRRLLERAIDERLDFAFETTLGGRTITRLLEVALSRGIEVRVWYVGLISPELHIERVKARVAAGGHDIPGEKIRERYNQSRENLIKLVPKLTELRVYDNSEDADPSTGSSPEPRLILHMEGQTIADVYDLAAAPAWAKAILIEAIRLQG
jgi:predicted ABC-type ATPase